MIPIPKDIYTIIKYGRYISEQLEQYERILLTKGNFLTVADTGAGKTRLMIKLFKRLSEKYPNKVFIISCPNKVQNLQNEKTKITRVVAIVEGVIVDSSLTIASMVYDKAESIIKNYDLMKNKEVTLVIDEAHQLVYANNFRKKAIEGLEKLQEHCFNVIHLTATPRALYQLYKYDEVILFEPHQRFNNMENLNIINCKDDLSKKTALLEIIKTIFTNNKKPLIFADSIAEIQSIKELLELVYSKKIEILSSENKIGSEVFDSVVEHELIPNEVDILLSTSVLECGTNIKNTDFIPIYYVVDNNHFNIDKVAQSFARTRKDIENGYLLFQEVPADTTLKTFELIHQQEIYLAGKVIDRVNRFIKANLEILELETCLSMAEHLIKLDAPNNSSYGKGYIYIDHEEKVAKVDYTQLIKYCLQRLDYSYLNHTEVLVNELKMLVKCENIKYMNYDKESKAGEQIVENQKQISKNRKQKKEQLLRVLKEVLDQDQHSKNLYIDYLKLDNDERYTIKMHFPTELEEVVLQIEADKKIKEDIEKLIFKYETPATPIEMQLEILLENNFDELALLEQIYKKLNKTDIKAIGNGTNYSIIRNKLDSRIQRRISEKILFELYKELNPRAKAKKLQSKSREKLLKEISLIYNLNSDIKGYRITSLKN